MQAIRQEMNSNGYDGADKQAPTDNTTLVSHGQPASMVYWSFCVSCKRKARKNENKNEGLCCGSLCFGPLALCFTCKHGPW